MSLLQTALSHLGPVCREITPEKGSSIRKQRTTAVHKFADTVKAQMFVEASVLHTHHIQYRWKHENQWMQTCVICCLMLVLLSSGNQKRTHVQLSTFSCFLNTVAVYTICAAPAHIYLHGRLCWKDTTCRWDDSQLSQHIPSERALSRSFSPRPAHSKCLTGSLRKASPLLFPWQLACSAIDEISWSPTYFALKTLSRWTLAMTTQQRGLAGRSTTQLPLQTANSWEDSETPHSLLGSSS